MQKMLIDDSTSQFDASVSRALGGGASVFLDIRSLSGDATQDGSAVAVGTNRIILIY